MDAKRGHKHRARCWRTGRGAGARSIQSTGRVAWAWAHMYMLPERQPTRRYCSERGSHWQSAITSPLCAMSIVHERSVSTWTKPAAACAVRAALRS